MTVAAMVNATANVLVIAITRDAQRDVPIHGVRVQTAALRGPALTVLATRAVAVVAEAAAAEAVVQTAKGKQTVIDWMLTTNRCMEKCKRQLRCRWRPAQLRVVRSSVQTVELLVANAVIATTVVRGKTNVSKRRNAMTKSAMTPWPPKHKQVLEKTA